MLIHHRALQVYGESQDRIIIQPYIYSRDMSLCDLDT